MRLSVIVPCYNEEENIFHFHEKLSGAFSGVSFDYEIIFVNDGSNDGTLKKMKALYERSDDNIKIISFSRNFGKEAAIYAGIRESVGDYVSLIDADLQQSPEILLDMVRYLDENEAFDCVAAYQENRKEGKSLIFFKNAFYKIINKMAEIDFVAGASDFRTFRRSMADAIIEMSEYHRFSKGIFSWVGFSTYYMPYEVLERSAGDSKWSFWKLFKYALDGIIAFTTIPLRLSTFIGLLTSLFSIVYLIVVVIQKLCFSIDVPGYATIVVLILLLGGLQLFSMGMIGEYLSRVYIQVKGRPIYIAKEILSYEDRVKNKKSE